MLCCNSRFNTIGSHKLIRKRRVVLLQGQLGVRVHLGQRNGGERLPGLGVGAVVHAADADAERHGEVALLRAERHLVQDNRLQVALFCEQWQTENGSRGTLLQLVGRGVTSTCCSEVP